MEKNIFFLLAPCINLELYPCPLPSLPHLREAAKVGGWVKGRAIKEKYFFNLFFQRSKISTAI